MAKVLFIYYSLDGNTAYVCCRPFAEEWKSGCVEADRAEGTAKERHWENPSQKCDLPRRSPAVALER